jgi:hypothetical protein
VVTVEADARERCELARMTTAVLGAERRRSHP